MKTLLDHKIRYLQIAFNYDAWMVQRILPQIPQNPRILIEAGTPFIKREGIRGIALIRRMWRGMVVADIKVADGALGEVEMAHRAGADAITVLGNAPHETLDLVIATCRDLNMISMVDMVGVNDPLKVIMALKKPPEVVVLHRGRDEESTRSKVIQYRHVNRLRSKYNVLISAAGGMDVKGSRSAIFNGANIVVANLVQPGDRWTGISTQENVGEMAKAFLTTIE
jgi:bifunctional enzyme Fae/Hps